MWGVVGVAMVAAVIVWFEVPRQWKQRSWRDLSVFGVILVCASVLLSLESYQVKLPNPLAGIEWVLRSIGRMF
ncbi:hypothetical protein [Cohnella zeiphila]|uniref:Uncharacterized protein n=1 Tax=Cohnella zeiphila TaxID=2761120 RepID=A0A7X0SJN5_9BACL|nr:hypothetical protein [Cohnella zeiphila]MBB6731187.1 hypothetical protein [Cohnella zeiphila]